MKSKLRNYYDVLKVSPKASPKAINAKHRALAKEYHPDVNKSKDAHEKMTMLNEAYEILSDTGKRTEYDKKLKQDLRTTSGAAVKAAPHSKPFDAEMRAQQAEQARRKAEEKMRNEEIIRTQRMAHAKKRAEEKAVQKKQEEFISALLKRSAQEEKENAVNLLKMLVRQGNARLSRNEETDEEKHHAIKVLLSLVREDNKHLQKLTEETERKQRIEEIIALVNASKEEKMVE